MQDLPVREAPRMDQKAPPRIAPYRNLTALPEWECIVKTLISGGAGEGNRTLVVSLGRLGRRGETKDFRHMPCSENTEQPVNETGFLPDVTAALPRLENGVSIDPRWQRPVSEVIADITYALPEWQFEKIRRTEPGHIFAKYTYFARCETTGNIKIGRSFDPEARMRQIKTATGNQHTLLATVRGGENESSYHIVFSFHRIEGEWFSPHPDILTEIERLGGGL